MRASDHRSRARLSLSGNWQISILTAFIAGLLGGTLSSGSASFTYNLDESTLEIPWLAIALTAMLSVSIIYSAVIFIIGGTVRLGYCQFLLNQHDCKPLSVRTLFSHFHQYGNGFVLQLLTALYTALWSLLFIIPGIIASYRYAMAPFIQAEHPEYTASESLRASKEMMAGYKWKLFCLDLSFIGWIYLSILTLGIGFLFLTPYTQASKAAFYRALCAKQYRHKPIAAPQDTAHTN